LTPKTQPANKSIASKAPITGRHHPGIPSDMISESVGDIIGIRSPVFRPRQRTVGELREAHVA
jgi:hypothetical protein